MARLDMALLAKANIDSAVASGDTSISVDDTSLFPSNTPFRVVLASKRTNLIPSDVEVVEVGSVDTTNNNLDSCTRGLEGTSAQSWDSGDIVENRATPELLNQISQALYDSNLAKVAEVNGDGDLDLLGNSLKSVSTLEADIISSPSVIGLRMNWTDDVWEYIDSEGNALGWTPDFSQLSPWNQIRRVNMNSDGEIVAAWGDDDYEHAPTDRSVNVMVEIPAFWFNYNRFTEGGKTYSEFYVANYNAAGMEPFPHVNQGSQPEAYLGAYEAGFRESGGSYLLTSRSGVQPWTGGQIWEVDMDALTNEPSIGDQVSTPNDSAWFVVDVDWANGTMWVRKPGDDSLDWLDNDTITNDTQSNTVADCEFTTGSKDALHFDIEEARTYGQNWGAGWQQKLVWGYAAHRILSMIYLGSMDFQSEIGRGIVDKDSGSGFNGEVTGYDSIDAQLSEANLGTATGTGSDGYTPVSILWVENPYGNIWTFVDGYEAVDSEYRILVRDGSWSVVGPDGWGSSDYEVSTASPLTDDDGYVNDIEAEELLALLGIPAATAGSDSTYIPDYFWSHDSGENNILRSGGYWANGSKAGLGSLYSASDVGYSLRFFGARLEFIG